MLKNIKSPHEQPPFNITSIDRNQNAEKYKKNLNKHFLFVIITTF